MNDRLIAATRRLLKTAEGDTGTSMRARNFLLAWWNARDCGGFDLVDLACVDRQTLDDMLLILHRLAEGTVYPDSQTRGTAGTDIPKRFERLARGRIEALEQHTAGRA